MQPRAHIDVDSLYDGVDFSYDVSRVRFEHEVSAVLRRVAEPMAAALKEAGIDGGAVAEVLMVGGSSHVLAVQRAVKGFFKDLPSPPPLRTKVVPQEAAVIGATMQAGRMDSVAGDAATPASELPNVSSVVLAPQSISVATADGRVAVVIPQGTVLPCERRIELSVSQDDQTAAVVQLCSGERAVRQTSSVMPTA